MRDLAQIKSYDIVRVFKSPTKGTIETDGIHPTTKYEESCTELHLTFDGEYWGGRMARLSGDMNEHLTNLFSFFGIIELSQMLGRPLWVTYDVSGAESDLFYIVGIENIKLGDQEAKSVDFRQKLTPTSIRKSVGPSACDPTEVARLFLEKNPTLFRAVEADDDGVQPIIEG